MGRLGRSMNWLLAARELTLRRKESKGNLSCRSEENRSINRSTHTTVGRVEIGNGDRFGVRVWGAP